VNIPQTHEWVRAAMAVAGVLSIYLGYRLFCNIAAQRTLRRSILLTNMASGALLALFGLGILVADVRAVGAIAHRSESSWEKKSSQQPKLNRHAYLPDRLI
jgi:hypothetical protein